MKRGLKVQIFISMFILLLSISETGSGHTPHDDVYGLVLSPEYAQDQTAFAIIRGNFFRSIDGGETWQYKVQGLDNTHGLHSVTISPQSKNILYVSTIGDGVYKSTDGGETWVATNNQLPDLNIRQIVASKQSPDVVLAVGNQAGFYRTDDGGASWQVINESGLADKHLTALGFVSPQSERVYAGDAQGTIYISDDLGVSWRVCCSLPNAGAIMSFEFATQATDEPQLFVGTEKGGLFTSTDGGHNWLAQNDGITGKNIQSIWLSSDFLNDRTIYVAAQHSGVFRSDDGGTHWGPVNVGLFTNNQALGYKRPSFSSIRGTLPTATADTLFLATFTGIYKTENRGERWQSKETLAGEIIVGLSVGKEASAAPAVGVSHYMGDAYVIHQDGRYHINVQTGIPGMDIVEDVLAPVVSRIRFGVNVRQLLRHPTRLHDIAFSPAFPTDQTAFVTVKNYLLRTDDGGESWRVTNINDDPWGVQAFMGTAQNLTGYVIALSPTFEMDDTLFIGMQDGALGVSTDRGDSLKIISTVADKLTSLKISPDFDTDGVLFATGYHSGVHKSTDGGITWASANQGLNIESGSMAGEFQLALSPTYAHDQTLFLGTVAGLFQSTTGGESWIRVACDRCESELNVAALAVSPNFENDGTVVFSAKGMGLFKSTDRGSTFTQAKDALLEQDISFGNLSNSPATSGALKFSPNYATDSTIFGFSNTTLAQSTDGGQTWQVVPPNTFSDLHAIEINLIYGRHIVYPLIIGGGLVFIIVALVLLRKYRFQGQVPAQL